MNYGPKVKKYCKDNNITLDDNTRPDAVDICVTSPAGKVLRSMGDHSAVTYFYRGPGHTKADGWEGVWEDLSMGLDDCTLPNCEFCNPPKE